MKMGVFRVAVLITIVGAGVLLNSFAYKNEKVYNTEDIVNKMFVAITNIKTMRYKLKIEERINGKIEHRESTVKLQTSPRKIYLNAKPQEVLWVQGTNDGNALVSPGSFPYVNLNLDPMGSLMRKDQHHTIHELGYNYIYGILKNCKDKYSDTFKKHFFITDEEVFEGRKCYKLSLLIPDFGWEPYTLKKGDNIVSIARKRNISEYMILEKNPHISDYDDVKEGKVIQLPNAYSKYTVVLIDEELMLPLSIKMIDDKGLFESYQYIDLKVNTPISSEEFTKNYKGYNF